MKANIRHAFTLEMNAAYAFIEARDLDKAMLHLERAHVIGQRYVVPHVQTHWHMLRIGLERRAMSEVRGQALRIVLGALGSALGVVPTGNTGGTNISMFARLPVPPEIQRILAEK